MGEQTSSSPMKQASFAPRNIVNSNVGAAPGVVARSMMRSKALFNRDDV
jgi:hypothetical protein